MNASHDTEHHIEALIDIELLNGLEEEAAFDEWLELERREANRQIAGSAESPGAAGRAAPAPFSRSPRRVAHRVAGK